MYNRWNLAPAANRVDPSSFAKEFIADCCGDTVCKKPVEDQFARGWNAAIAHIRANPLPIPLPEIERVIFHDPATIVYWKDGTKTVVKCQSGDVFCAETGLTAAMLKKYMGNDNTFNKHINKWLQQAAYVTPPALPEKME